MKAKQRLRALFALLLVVCMLGQSMVVVAIQEENEASQAEKGISFEQVGDDLVSVSLIEDSDSVVESETYSDDDVVRVAIMVEGNSVIDQGYSTKAIAENDSAMEYRQQMLEEQAVVQRAIEQELGERLDVEWNLTLLANAIAANVEYGQIEEIKLIDGVEDVWIDQVYYPDVVSVDDTVQTNMVFSSEMVGVQDVWAAGYKGAGTRIAIIDTGLDTDHQSVSEGGYLTALRQTADENDMYIGNYMDTLDLLDKDEIRDVLTKLNAFTRGGNDASKLYINAKIPFGFNYHTNSYDVTHDNDTAGAHGSHVAGIAAANRFVPNGTGGYTDALENVMVAGAAPDAQLLVMKVFGSNGASGWDIISAVEDAIILGADTINLSLGTTYPGYSTASSLGTFLEKLKNTDTVAVISAGNNYDWAYLSDPGNLYADDVNTFTMGDPGSGTNSLSVASVENSGKIMSGSLTVGGQLVEYNEIFSYSDNPKNTPIMDMDTSSSGSGTEYEYIFFEHYGYAEDFAGYEDAIKDKVVLCSRGGDNFSFSAKANNAMAAGAKAVIIYNNVAGSINMDLSDFTYEAPCVSITKEAAQKFVKAGVEAKGEDGKTYYIGTLKISKGRTKIPSVEGAAYEMSSFSSWGVTGDLALKPEITAPGGYIYSIDGRYKNSTDKYTTMSGTSMAAPQVSGVGALVREFIEDKGYRGNFANSKRGLAQSLLMSTAAPIMDSDGNYYPVIQQGAGLVDAKAAVSADSYIKMNRNATVSYDDGKVKAELGDDPDRLGVYSFSFTINNLDGQAHTYDLTAAVFAQDSYKALAKTGKNNDLEYKTYYMDRSTIALDGDTIFTVNDEPVNAVEVEAGDTETVEVTIDLSEDDRDYLDKYFKNGTYIQAYVFANGQSDKEGVAGTCHSIPVLAFYGNWTESSMFYGVSTKEGQALMNYSLPSTTDNSRTAYFDWGVDQWGEEIKPWNYFRVTNSNGTYQVGGNPLVADDTYMPERNAVNGNISLVYGEAWLSRNAIQLQSVVKDADNNYYAANLRNAEVLGAFRNNSASNFGSHTVSMYMEEIPEEGAELEFYIRALPEYYSDGKMGEDSEPGEGAFVRIKAKVDNTIPEVIDMKFYAAEDKISVTAKDENYIAAVVLYNAEGDKVLTFDGAEQSIAAGEPANYDLDLSAVTGKDFLIQVFDYACNMATYRIEIEDGVMNLNGALLAYNRKTSDWAQINKATEQLYQVTETTNVYNAATSVGETIFAVNDAKELYAISSQDFGEVRMITTLSADVVDLAYNAADQMIYGVTSENKLISIDPETGSAAAIGTLPITTNTLACDANGIFYSNKYGTGEIYAYDLLAVESGISENYDFNDDNTVNALDSQLLLDYVLGIALELNGEEYADIDIDGDVDTHDVYKLQQMVGSYPEQIAVAPEIKSKYLQAMEIDPNRGILYWSSYFTDYMPGVEEELGFSILWEIDVESGDVTRHYDYWDQLTALVVLDHESSRTFPPVDGIRNLTLSKSAATLAAGEELTLQAVITPWNTRDNAIIWTSSDESVATVDENGIVTAVSVGECEITAVSIADGSHQDSCTITISSTDQSVEQNTPVEVSAYAIVNNTQKANYLALQEETVTVDLHLRAVEDTTNGLQTISYDSELLELVSVYANGLSGYTVSGDLAAIAFVPADVISEGDNLITVTFRVKDGGMNAELLLRELQRNNKHLDIETARTLAGHVWGNWMEKIAPTCGKAGEETRTCANCDEIETRVIPATGKHSWGIWSITKPATESEEGERIRICSSCGSNEIDATHANGLHIWGEWTVTTEATCSVDGEKVSTCVDCDERLTIILPATGEHIWGEWIKDETAGIRTRECSVCHEVQTKTNAADAEGTAVDELFNFFTIGQNYVRDVLITGAEVVNVTLLEAEPEVGENSRLHYLVELSRSADEVDSVHAKFRISAQTASGIGSAFINVKQDSVMFEDDVTDYDIDISSGTGSMTAWSYWDSSTCMAVHLEFVIVDDETPCVGPAYVYGGDGYLDSLNIWGVQMEKATGIVDTSAGNRTVTCVVWLDSSTPDDATVGIQLIPARTVESLPEDWTTKGGYVQLKDGEAEISGIRVKSGFYRTDYIIYIKNHHESIAPELLQGSEISLQAELGIPFSLDFRSYFADRNGDVLTYMLSVDGGEAKEYTNQKYHYTPTTTEPRVLTVYASDGTQTSGVCTITIQPIEDHVWGAWVVTEEATCTEDGVEKHTCICCGTYETRAVAGSESHSWGEWQTAVDDSGAATSVKLRQCLVCGEYQRSATIVYGDIDADGEVDIQDAGLLARYLAKWTGLTVDLVAADVNADGAVDMKDIILLRRYLADWDVVLGG